VALITGASAGIGRELARLLAQHGYDLVVTGRRIDRLEELRRELGAEYQTRVIPLRADLADPRSPDRLVADIKNMGLSIEVLINDAGFGKIGDYSEFPWPTTQDMIQVNLTVLMHLTRLVLPDMITRGRGKILNVGSTAAWLPGPYMAVYYAVKAAVVSFSEALWAETRGTGVTVTCLCPGPTHTEFHQRAGMREIGPLGVMTASDVAAIGLRAMERGRRLVVAGWRNALTTAIMNLVPHRILLIAVSRIHGR